MNQFIRSLALTFLLFFSITYLFGQMTAVQSTWPMAYDTNWVQVNVPYAFKYYRDFKPFNSGKPGGYVRDYYQNGALQMEGTLSEPLEPGDNSELKREGVFTWYYPTGKIQTISLFNDNKLHGRRTTYYLNGNKMEDGEYVDGKAEGLHQMYYENGLPKLLGKYTQGVLLGNLMNQWDENGIKLNCYIESFITIKNLYKWELGDFANYTASLQAGTGFTVKNKDNLSICHFLWKPVDLEGDRYSYEAVVASNGGDNTIAYGIAFEFKDWKNYRYFLINDNGQFTVGEMLNGVTKDVMKNVSNPAIFKTKEFGSFVYDNQNTLSIIVKDNKTIFTINNQAVYTAPTAYGWANNHGFFIGPGTKSVTLKSFTWKTIPTN